MDSATLLVDIPFLRFFYRYFFNEYIKTQSNNKGILDVNAKKLYEEGKYQNLRIIEKLLDNKEIFEDIERVLDALTDNWIYICKAIIPSWGDQISFFGESLTQSNRVIWLAVTEYLKRFSYNDITFRAWMRVVWNIVSNTDINDNGSMVSAMNVISDLSNQADKIYEYLESGDFSASSSKQAIAEEITKAEFIVLDHSWENDFIKAESHKFFKGGISFLISEGMNHEVFNHRFDMSSKVFVSNGVCENYRQKDHIFLRAMISRISTTNDLFEGSRQDRNFFVDTYEKENYLKKFLLGNKRIKIVLQGWFDLNSEQQFLEELQKNVESPSSIIFDSEYTNEYKNKVIKVHELLYKQEYLQTWMQKHKAIRLSWWNYHIYISRPSSSKDWVMLDSERNDVINYLVDEQGFSCDNKLIYKENETEKVVPKLYCGKTINSVTGKINHYESKFDFDDQGTFTISFKTSDSDSDWIVLSQFENIASEIKVIQKLEEQIFDENYFTNLLNQNQSST